mgnify:CR=1 FL=1
MSGGYGAGIVTPLGSRGIGLALDDFGVGQSSLASLTELPLDVLKLDRSLVDGIQQDRNRQALMNAMVAFAATLGASVIAEGVEIAAELEVLRAAGVGHVQGYLLARPAPAWCAAANPAVTTRQRGLGALDALGGVGNVSSSVRGGDAEDDGDAASRSLRERREALEWLERRLVESTDPRAASAAVVRAAARRAGFEESRSGAGRRRPINVRT